MGSHKDVTRADAHAPGKIEDFVEFDEVAAPATPATGIVRVYAKTDGALYAKDDAGTETALGGGGGGGGGGTVSAWTSFTLGASWVAFGDGYATPGYRTLIVDGETLVFVRGLAKSGTTSDGTIVATLPVGLRPDAHLNVTANRTGTQDPFAWFIETDGSMEIYGVGGNSELPFDVIPPFWAA